MPTRAEAEAEQATRAYPDDPGCAHGRSGGGSPSRTARGVVELPVAASRPWRAGQALGLMALAAFLAALALRPETALRILWSGLVPALPALFLVSPLLWRNVCPLATLSTLASRLGRRTRPDPRWSRRAVSVGPLLLAALIPGRNLGFETDPAAVASAAVAAVGLAVAGGLRYGWKSGFCNAFCPMLPLERLYGQAQLASVANGRCDRCTLCSSRGCLDLAGPRSVPQVMGPSRHRTGGLTTPFGAFAGAFPGVVVGFHLAPGSGPVGATAAYGAVLGGALVSYVGMRLATGVAGWPWRRVMRTSAAVSALLFYWLSAESVSVDWGLGAPGIWAIRLAGIVLVAVWVTRSV